MNQLICQHVKHLKSALLSLPATGEKGFEGLIGATLCEISGVPFRLASSGPQFGVDGKPAYEGDAICFEGKRYNGGRNGGRSCRKCLTGGVGSYIEGICHA